MFGGMQDDAITMKWNLVKRINCANEFTLWLGTFTCRYHREREREKGEKREKEGGGGGEERGRKARKRKENQYNLTNTQSYSL